jgi:hypothetical protein
MLFTLWRRMRISAPPSFRANEIPKGRCLSFRPRLEALEDRIPLAQLGGIAAADALSGLQPIGSQPARTGVYEMQVTVNENSAPTVIDLGSVFAGINGIQHDDGLRLSLLGNTNAGLVTPDLSGRELTLTYTPSHWGTATIMVSATDADGVFVQENILVTVLPLAPANGRTGQTSSLSTGRPMSATTGGSMPTASTSCAAAPHSGAAAQEVFCDVLFSGSACAVGRPTNSRV